MTNHYKVQILLNGVTLKLSYRRGKFFRAERLTGSITDQQIKQLGHIIPPKESDIKSFQNTWNERVTYQEIKKQKSLFTKFSDEWFKHYEEEIGLPPKFTGVDGKALKQIIAYLKRINAGNEQVALDNWILILSKYETLKEFHKENKDLKYINSRLNVIVREIITNNGSSSAGSNGSIRI
ncbi:hypothetical protein [Pseudotenacibaculum haliotis]|uniref:Uncharacterized protein n=1 Tax=Pseudotenacibaculum haliotis TaxID=1862138 RepID=A0ABW5LQD3_9FLAO